MTNTLRLLVASVLVGILALPSDAARPPKKDKPKRTAPPKAAPELPGAEFTPPASVSLTDDLEKLKEQLGLTDEQVTKLTGLREQRDKALAKHDDGAQRQLRNAQGRIEKMKRPQDRDRAMKMVRSRELVLGRTRQALAATHEKKMFALLKPAQKAKWNAPLLQTEVEKQFEGISLTDDQKAKIQALSETQAKRLTVPFSTKTHAAIVRLLANQANLRVLTPEQKKEYAKKRTAEAAAKRRRGSR